MTRSQWMPLCLFLALTTGACASHEDPEAERAMNTEPNAPIGHRLPLDDSEIYFETLGSGSPLLLLHGAFATAESWTPFLERLTREHQVIIVEQQGHGHSPDRAGLLTYPGMAADTAALLDSLKLKKVEVFGYSDGGIVAIQLARSRPDLVASVAVLGANLKSIEESCVPGFRAQIESIPADFAPPPIKEPYDRVAPRPEDWPQLVAKIKTLALDFEGFADDDLGKISAAVLLMLGDRDSIRGEHMLEMQARIPGAEVAILPGADHFVLFTRPDSVMEAFLDFFARRREGRRSAPRAH